MSTDSNDSLPSSRERARLAVLHSYRILDTPAEAAFDDFVRIAAVIAGTPTALVSFVDGERQWFKARVGLAACETARNVAFCAHAIEDTQVLVVPDATRDPRFANNPLVTGAPGIRFYAGAPLLTPDGHAVGTLCVIDYVPREFSLEQRQALQALSGHVMAQLELRRRLAEFTRSNLASRSVTAEVARALEERQFVLQYLPTVDVLSGRIESLEALIRWNSPQRGLLGPDQFIPMLEESGLIVDVGAWVLRQTGDDYRTWLEHGLTAPRITVNVSSGQLLHPNFCQTLASAIDPDGASHVPIDIEITEGVILENTPAVVRILDEVQRMGVQIAIDDFGTGYSSMRYLAHLPVNTLKIDRSFVRNMTASPDEMGIVTSIISLAHSLNLNVVAEGVETDDERKLLRLLRCDLAQGYFFSKPLGLHDMEAMLRSDQQKAASEWTALMQEGSVERESASAT